MCGEGDCGRGCYPKWGGKLQRLFRALHCPSRWTIIRILGDGPKSTSEIFEKLKEMGEDISKSGLYYHLSELEEAGIIEQVGYREVGGGAPEKIWKLKIREIKIDLLKDLPEMSDDEC